MFTALKEKTNRVLATIDKSVHGTFAGVMIERETPASCDRTLTRNTVTSLSDGVAPVDLLGGWSASAVVALGALYLVALASGVFTVGLERPIGDPILAIMEVITVLSAVAVMTMVAALAANAPPSRRIYGSLSVTFTGLFTGTTTVVHVIALSAARELDVAALVWPSMLYAAELAAWDVLLGVALVFAALALDESKRLRVIRIGLCCAGALCLAGIVGPMLGRMPLQRIGIVGYAVVLPCMCALIAQEFRGRASIRGQAVI